MGFEMETSKQKKNYGFRDGDFQFC
jgi:hypothetical protein